MSITLTIECRQHPKYKGTRKPKSVCSVCDFIFTLANTVKVTAAQGKGQ